MRRRSPTSAPWCARARARTWREFDRRVNRIARTLAGMGIGKGDKIAILAGELGRVSRDLHGRPAGRRLRRAAVDHGGGRCAGEDARRLRRQGAVPVGPVSQPGRALRRPAGQADPGRPPRLRFRAPRAGTTSSTGSPMPATCRSSSRSSSSTTSTSSIPRARPACPRASCTPTPCATCWRCA